MNILAVQIAKTLLSMPSLDQGLDWFINLVLRWSVLTNHEVALQHFKKNADQIPALKARDTVSFWDDILQSWPESKKIHELVLWSTNSILQKGFNTTINNYSEQELDSVTGSLSNQQHFAKQLAILSPIEAMECLSDAVITWAWHIDSSELKRHAVQTGRYRNDWTNKDLVDYVFLNLHVLVNEGLLQRDFTTEFINQWR